EGAHSLRHESAAFDLAAPARNHDPIHVLDAFLSGELRTDLGKHLRHQLTEPSDPARHDAGGVLLGHTIGRDDVGVFRVAGRTYRIIFARETLRHRTVLTRVERVAERRLERFI